MTAKVFLSCCQAGYDVYRINIHANHEIYDWRGDDLNTRTTPLQPGFVPLHFVRAFRKLELLARHNDSSRYGALLSRSNSLLITRVQLAEVRKAQPKDLFWAGIGGGIAALNRGTREANAHLAADVLWTALLRWND